MQVIWNGILYEAKDEFEVKGVKGKKIKTTIPPAKRTMKNVPRYSDGKMRVRYQDWLEMKDFGKLDGDSYCYAKGCDGKWYGWSHRAIYGFKVGDKVKKGDCAYDGKEYTIKTEKEAKETAKRFADSVS